MRVEAGRKEYLTNNQIETIFKQKMIPFLNNHIKDEYNNLNRLGQSNKVLLVQNLETKKYIVLINEGTQKNEKVILENSFFDKQTRGMCIAKANSSEWTNQALLKEFQRSMKILVAKI